MQLHQEERARAAAVIEAAERASGLHELFTATLAAIDDYLRRNHHTSQLSVRLAAGGTDAYLTIVGADAFSFRDLLAMHQLIEPLTAAMRARLPRGVEGVLSMREAQAAELVTLGFTN